MRAAQALTLVKREARKHNLTVDEMPGRGKGSHRMYRLLDSTGSEVARFGLTDHPGDLSWRVLTRLEQRLEPVLGEKWTEKR